MATKTYIYVRYILAIFFLLCLVILTACSGNLIATPLSTNTQVPASITPTSTEVPPSATPTLQPFSDLKEWDLLIVSSSTNWGVGQYYAELIEDDMNVKVNLHDCWVGGLDIRVALKYLQNRLSWSSYVSDQSCNKPLSDLVKDAEVMVLFGGPFASYPGDDPWDIPESFKACIQGGYEGKNLLPEFDAYKDKMLKSCAPETWSKYQADLGAFLDEIDKIRDGRPLILRLTTSYILHSSYIENGVDDVCTKCTGYISEAIRQVAEEYGVPVADTMVGLNGKDYLSEVPAGYIGEDGIHPSDAGAQFIATLLQKTGYEYAGK